MFNISTTKSTGNTMDIFYKAFHLEKKYRWSGTGFVGSVQVDENKFWVMDKKNVYTKGRSYKYYVYRRFEGHVKSHKGMTEIEGDFKILPLYRNTLIGYFIFLSLVVMAIIASAFATGDFVTFVKNIIPLILMYLVGVGAVALNLYKAKPYEYEIIEYLEDLLSDEILSKDPDEEKDQ